LKVRGGSNEIIDVSDIDCGIQEGLRYVNNERLRKIIGTLFRLKKNNVIFITAAAVCHLAKIYGITFPALPIPVVDFGLTSYYQLGRKIVVAILIGVAAPLFYLQQPIPLVISSMLLVGAMKCGFANLDYIPTSLIEPNIPMELIKGRIPDIVDVVSVNLPNEQSLSPKILMKQNEKVECWLPDQRLGNTNCAIKSTDIPEVITKSGLNYEDVVNMRDVTGLTKYTFSDIYQVHPENLDTPDINVKSPNLRGTGKTVNFLDKYSDSENLDPSTSWDVDTNSIKTEDIAAERIKN
jgi:hypothetical protein